MEKHKLYDKLISSENIYKAIYSLHSYIQEPDLLDTSRESTYFNDLGYSDKALYDILADPYAFDTIVPRVIKLCRERLQCILNNRDELFEAKVFFKIKKVEPDSETETGEAKLTFRPLHTASLIDQICMAALLQPLMYDDTDTERELSQLSKLIPSYFYGNIPSKDPAKLFEPWALKYREYTGKVNQLASKYKKTREYDNVISLDIKDFFPSVDPERVYGFIQELLYPQFQGGESDPHSDRNVLRTLLTKLLYVTIPADNLEGHWEDYYPNIAALSTKDDMRKVDGKYMNRGLCQGLPQAYFFSNLCMLKVAETIKKILSGKNGDPEPDAYYYVDDSIIYTHHTTPEAFPNLIQRINKKIENMPAAPGIDIPLGKKYRDFQKLLNYGIRLHPDDKSTIADISEAFEGFAEFYNIQRTVSQGGWFKGNIDEIDDNVSFKKLDAIVNYVNTQLDKAREEKKIVDKVDSKSSRAKDNDLRIKWLKRYKQYFLYRQRKMKLQLLGELTPEFLAGYLDDYKFRQVVPESEQFGKLAESLPESHEEETSSDTEQKPEGQVYEQAIDAIGEGIFNTQMSMLFTHLDQEGKDALARLVAEYERKIVDHFRKNRKADSYLYYAQIAETMSREHGLAMSGYESLTRIMSRVRLFSSTEKIHAIIKGQAPESVADTIGLGNPIWGRLTTLDNYWQAPKEKEESEESDEAQEDKPQQVQEDNEKDKQEGQKEDKDIAELDDPERTRLPLYSRFIFMTSRDFRRRVLNCCYSLVSSVTPSDNMSFVRNGVKSIRYYELRTMAILRNRRMDDLQGLKFIADIDITDINERMPIDMAVLEVLDIFRQRIQDWRLIDMMIQTHRVVKSLWHNGSKYLNSYTLHNHEHAVCLIHNVVRTVNNIDYLNLKQYDYFLLFQACYLHDISMIVHPDVSLFNSADPKAEGIISSWFSKIWTFVNSIEDEMESENGSLDIDRFHALRKEFGMKLIRIHKDIYNYFENRIRSGHAHDSAAFIRNWQKGYLSYLSPVDAEHIAEISDSHGWDAPDVYHRKSNAQSQLISVKYMMMLIRIADLLDLANDRIDLYLL